MNRLVRRAATVALVASGIASPAQGQGAEPLPDEPKLSGTITGSYYAMRDQADFGVGVASVNRGALRLEARYNYEARHSASLFVGWKLTGGDTITYEITPIAGGLFGDTHAVIPGVEASIAYRSFDVYIEAEYVNDLRNHGDSYFYSWNELGWRPVEWLRLGLVGQRTRTIQNERDLQRGAFAQLILRNLTVGVFAFNPEAASRYTIISVAMNF
jgi:hypothetical protein